MCYYGFNIAIAYTNVGRVKREQVINLCIHGTAKRIFRFETAKRFNTVFAEYLAVLNGVSPVIVTVITCACTKVILNSMALTAIIWVSACVIIKIVTYIKTNH